MDYITLSILLLIIIPYLVYGYFWWKSRKIQEEPSETNVLELFYNELQQIKQNTSTILLDQLKQDDVQQELAEIIMNSIISLFEAEEFKQIVSQYFSQTQVIPGADLSEQDLKEVEQNAKLITSEAILDNLDPKLQLVLDRLIPDWRKQVQENPKKAIATIQALDQFGLISLLEKFKIGENKKNIPTKTTGW